MLKTHVLDVVGDLRQQAQAGLPVDALAVAKRLTLACLNGQESQIFDYLKAHSSSTSTVETAQVAADLDMSIQQAGTILIDLHRMGIVERSYAERNSPGRPRALWWVPGGG